MATYARFDPTTPEPRLVTGWYDTDMFTYQMPPANELAEVSAEQWASRLDLPYILGGVLVPRPAPAHAELVTMAVARLGAALADAANVAVACKLGDRTLRFSAGPDGQPQLNSAGLAVMMGLLAPVLLRTSDGTPVLLPVADVRVVLARVAAHTEACMQRYAALHALVLVEPGTPLDGWPTPDAG